MPSKGEHYTFSAHRWLSEKEGDRQIEVELEPSRTEDIEKSEWLKGNEERGRGTERQTDREIGREKVREGEIEKEREKHRQ